MQYVDEYMFLFVSGDWRCTNLVAQNLLLLLLRHTRRLHHVYTIARIALVVHSESESKSR